MLLQHPVHRFRNAITSASPFVMCPASVMVGVLQGTPLPQPALHPMYAFALAMAQRRVSQETFLRPYPPRLNLN